MNVDPRLKEWATERQAEIIDKVLELGSIRSTARALGVDAKTVSKSIKGAKKRAALQGYSPEHDMTRTVPDGFTMKGVSTLVDADGKVRAQWIKSQADHARREEMMREFAEALTEEVRARADAIDPPANVSDDLLSVYPFGDPHFGAYAYGHETGDDDFNLDVAERLTCGAIDRLVASSPPSRTALLISLGDTVHANDHTNKTQSGHVLDVDTRHSKVMRTTARAFRYCVDKLREKHERVIVWMMPGNHDPTASFALAMLLSAYFENDPRVEVDLSPGLFKYLRFGKVLIGSHHGHGAKFSELPGIMATDRPQDWGASTFRTWYCGHIHHKFRDKEHPGAVVETFRTLAPRDAWHAGQGYRAGRDLNLIVHHREHGEIERHRCDVAMLSEG